MKCSVITLLIAAAGGLFAQSQSNAYEVNDSHFHLTNYIQEGTPIQDFLKIMGYKVGRVALFGIPLQQQWSHRVDGDRAAGPLPELGCAPVLLFVYRCVYRNVVQIDATRAGRSLRSHDHWINPTDIYAADHIRRVLQTLPGLFTGIGDSQFTKNFYRRRYQEKSRVCRIGLSTESSISLPM
jgi:hypothetical protein